MANIAEVFTRQGRHSSRQRMASLELNKPRRITFIAVNLPREWYCRLEFRLT